MKPIHKFNGGIGATLCHKCSKIISTGFIDAIYCEDCGGQSSHKYILTRIRDNKIIKGHSVLYVDWDETGHFKDKYDFPEIGRSLVVDFNTGNFRWMTTKIKEILDMSDNLVRFVTLNSEYQLKIKNIEKI